MDIQKIQKEYQDKLNEVFVELLNKHKYDTEVISDETREKCNFESKEDESAWAVEFNAWDEMCVLIPNIDKMYELSFFAHDYGYDNIWNACVLPKC